MMLILICDVMGYSKITDEKLIDDIIKNKVIQFKSIIPLPGVHLSLCSHKRRLFVSMQNDAHIQVHVILYSFITWLVSQNLHACMQVYACRFKYMVYANWL